MYIVKLVLRECYLFGHDKIYSVGGPLDILSLPIEKLRAGSRRGMEVHEVAIFTL